LHANCRLNQIVDSGENLGTIDPSNAHFFLTFASIHNIFTWLGLFCVYHQSSHCWRTGYLQDFFRTRYTDQK